MGLNGEGVERGPRRPSAHIGNLEIPPYRATDRRSSHLELNARRDDAGAMITIAAWGTTGPGELPRFGSNPRALDWGTAASNACIRRALAPQTRVLDRGERGAGTAHLCSSSVVGDR